MIKRAKTGYSIRAAGCKLAFNALGGGCNAGDRVGLWGFEGHANDMWEFIPV